MQPTSLNNRRRPVDAKGQLSAIPKLQAVIEFDTDATILKANGNFLGALGYTLAEVKGRLHRIFVVDNEVNGEDYTKIWETLHKEVYLSDEYKRIAKAGSAVWNNASNNPILNLAVRPYKVVKYVVDVTARKLAMEALVDGLEHLAEANLTASLQAYLGGKFAVLRDTFNITLVRLDVWARGILEKSNVISDDPTAIAAHATDLFVPWRKLWLRWSRWQQV